jgi:hypothetical protein
MKQNVLLFLLYILFASFVFESCDDKENDVDTGVIQLNQIVAGEYEFNLADASQNTAVATGEPFKITFSTAVAQETIEPNIVITETTSGSEVPFTVVFENSDLTVVVNPILSADVQYMIQLTNGIRGVNGEKFDGFETEFNTVAGELAITSIELNGTDVTNVSRIKNVPLQGNEFVINFSKALDPSTVTSSNFRISGFSLIPANLSLSNGNKTVTVTPSATLSDLRRYILQITSSVKGINDESMVTVNKNFYSAKSATPDFPVISDDELLTLVQQKTFKYFYDFAEGNSGMARERNASGSLVTTGGSGFGLMALIIGIERNFITRTQGIERFDKILDFLETADRFHGAWPHWIEGTNGNVIPFSTNDNGGDLVETAFLVQGLITVRQYLNENDALEKTLIDRINVLWEGVEWDWYTKGGEDVLYWHWSPDKEWIMNFQLRGNNETMITYVLAASSPTHTIDADAYHMGYARNGAIQNGKTFYGFTLPLGEDYGGPLFFTHYSFLGLDPRNLSDGYANYWTQNVNHSMINHAYVVANPRNWVGYSDESWGLTASDNHNGYSAHSPTNDLGVISPTAALSSFPYTPEESMKALKFFYYDIGDRLWGDYGFYDAYNLTEGWTANSYLAIDQGPIVVMIENYRTGLLWDLFISAPEVQAGLTKLGFTY